MKKIAIIGSGSFATALCHLLASNGHEIHWWIRKPETLHFIEQNLYNPHYLTRLSFDDLKTRIVLGYNINQIIDLCDIIIIAVPSAFVEDVVGQINANLLQNKLIVSVIKGIVPSNLTLLNDYLYQKYKLPLENYVAIAGPCHAEELSAHKHSYLTFSSTTVDKANFIGQLFKTPYLQTIISNDVYGTQYCAVLKNVYALGMGIGHGLGYGDNLLSVYAINSCHELIHFLKIFHPDDIDTGHYLSSSYLGDLLVTAYSLYSRNRLFGSYIGKGYSIETTKIEMNMIAEGYYAVKCLHDLCTNKLKIEMPPIANIIYQILWEQKNPEQSFTQLKAILK